MLFCTYCFVKFVGILQIRKQFSMQTHFKSYIYKLQQNPMLPDQILHGYIVHFHRDMGNFGRFIYLSTPPPPNPLKTSQGSHPKWYYEITTQPIIHVVHVIFTCMKFSNFKHALHCFFSHVFVRGKNQKNFFIRKFEVLLSVCLTVYKLLLCNNYGKQNKV